MFIHTLLRTDLLKTELVLKTTSTLWEEWWAGSRRVPIINRSLLHSSQLWTETSIMFRVLQFSSGRSYLLMAFFRYCCSHLVAGLMQTSLLFFSLALWEDRRVKLSFSPACLVYTLVYLHNHLFISVLRSQMWKSSQTEFTRLCFYV